MGPRLISRGDVFARKKAEIPLDLQWGRGLLAAEIEADMTWANLVNALQWGRGLLAAEIYPRNLVSAVKEPSMGPRLISRGDLLGVCLQTLPIAFNGAAAY